MATTITATAAASNVPIKAVHAGVNAISSRVKADGTAMSASANATVFLMGKIPNDCRIVGAFAAISGGAATMPFDVGTSYGGSLVASAIANAGSTGVGTVNFVGPVEISLSDDAATQFKYVTVTVTPGTTTATAEVFLTVLYEMR
jgi:hypothetical protein